MISPSHAIAGAAIYTAIFGLSWQSALIGSFIGASPDLIDWAGASLGLWPRWKVYTWWHHNVWAFILSMILIAPLPHIIFDKFVHRPVLPKAGTDPFFDEIMWHWPFGIKLSRQRIFWLQGELMNLFFALWVFTL